MFDWDEGDRFSFEDSDRFEEDSLCSWISEPESLCNNWRGWKRPNGNPSHIGHGGHCRGKEGVSLSLVELAAREVAAHIPFEVVEHVYPPVPEQLQLRIAFWSFPENEEDIRLYSCLANGSADEFQRGEHLYKAKAIKELLQIGFHLSATVQPPQNLSVSKGSYSVAVTFDRCRITSCNCTCNSSASWCSHVVAVCLHRIHQPNQVCLRAPVSESLSRLHRDQLQKFAQYLISELPQQILPTAQRLLDELLSSQQTAINTLCGAPDPTAGASVHEQTTWCLDESTLHENIRKILIKLCVPSPIVFSDVNYLSTTAPPAAAEWCSLLRPLRGREPEGMWNLLSIVREMFRRSDRNAIPLLEILTEEVLACDQILVWWFTTKVSLHTGSGGHGGRGSVHGNTHASQHACSSLCDEIVILWRLAALNPALSPQDRKMFFSQMCEWHVKTLERVCKVRASGSAGGPGGGGGARRSDMDVFPGFKPALEACLLDWNDYPIVGATYADGGACRWYSPYLHLRHSDHSGKGDGPETSEQHTYCYSRRGRAVEIGNPGHHLVLDRKPVHVLCSTSQLNYLSHEVKLNSNRSSLSSEGFCENENDNCEDIMDKSVPPASGSSGSICGGSLGTQNSDILNCSTPKGSSTLTPSGISDPEPTNGEKSSPDDVDSDWSSLPENTPAGNNRLAKGEESHSNGDEYHVYYFNSSHTRISSPDRHRGDCKLPDGEKLAVQVKKIEDHFEILFARAEALHAHGHTFEACKLAVRLAEELLAHPPSFEIDSTPPPPAKGKRGRRFNPACHQMSLLASATLAKAAFLCQVLGENYEHHHLSFRIGLFGLEMARPPASTKALEVKLANQEQDLVILLKKIPLGEAELNVVREKAEALRDHRLQSRGDALLPLYLASYIFDALVLSGNNGKGAPHTTGKLPSDEVLGFEAAVAALGLKANVSEAEHPLLCEGTRRQRGELTITLLVHYKDDQEKLAKIMDKLLDKEVHQMYKAPSLSGYYSTASATPSGENSSQSKAEEGTQAADGSPDKFPPEATDAVSSVAREAPGEGGSEVVQSALNSGSNHEHGGGGAKAKVSHRHANRSASEGGDRNEGASSPGWEEDYKAWEAKFRCTNFRTNKKHSGGMASVDSSAPETTSSDNSPTVVRRSTWVRPGGPGSDSGSSGESSDSFVSSSSGDKATRMKPRDTESPLQNLSSSRFPVSLPGDNVNRAVPPVTVKPTRFKGKRVYPSIPNQPSEASAHFMFELAKTVLTKAGGNSSTAVLFTQPSASQNHRGPHRALHMCAFQIGLYALGLHNAVSPNWLSRTYSSHVSWITGQAMEIGSAAINFLIDTWEGHLTPPEVASLADRASRGRDPAMVRVAAELALSCLPHSHALNPNEIQRALQQCKEQSAEMLERACLAVESAAKGGGVYPEVLFDVARRWYELYDESQHGDHSAPADAQSNTSEAEVNPAVQVTVSSSGQLSASSTDHGSDSFVVDGVIGTTGPLQVVPQLSCPVSYPLPYAPPHYQYLQGVTPFHHLPVPLHPAYLPPPPAYHYPPLPNPSFYSTTTTTTSVRHGAPAPVYSHQILGLPVPSIARPVLPINGQPVTSTPSAPPVAQTQHQVQNSISQMNQRQIGYLLSAYRVGVLAMETLARRVHDDRPQAKYARNPPYGEDVKWLLGVAKKLGTSYLQEFCICTVNSVASPFVLHEIVLETAHHLTRSASAPLSMPVRSHVLTPLIQKCQQMFIACTHIKMYHITPAEYEEFVNIIRSARAAFLLTPGGMVQFNELLQSLRRSKSCKKELWQRIASAVATASI